MPRALELDRLVANSPAGLALWDLELRCVHVNQAFARAAGMAPAQCIGRDLADVLPHLPQATLGTLRRSPAEAEPLPDVELSEDGTDWLASFFAVRSNEGAVIGLGAVVNDITERKRLEESLAHRASHDVLTGLPNRRLFVERVAAAASRSRRAACVTGVLFVDLDGFKQVNDDLGHAAGDELLVEAARRIRTALRPSDAVGRLGGDEFGIVCEDLAHQRDGVAVAERVLAALSEPVRLGERQVVTGASVGLAFTTDRATDAEALLRHADTAMYRAKQQGGGRWEIFDRAMRTRLKRRFAFEHALRRAVDRGELRLVFQPQVSLVTGAPVGVEALVRWQHPERGLLAPDQFIAEAEATGAIHGLGAWVLEEACRAAGPLVAGNDCPLRISVNLSPAQFARGDLVDAIAGSLERHGVPPARLGVEITENLLMAHTRANAITVAALRTLGIRIVLDDFGAGYSSLAYLRRLPIDEIKLDRTFVSRLRNGTDGRGARLDERIASFVIGLTQALRLVAVAEGVETPAQAELLRGLGYDVVQGYLVGRPLALTDLQAMLTRGAAP
jgi:diguanylate cyclase (GGDEF)-like protein/PAS domain S-box-containing protein